MAAGKIALPGIDPARAQREIGEFLVEKIIEAGMNGGVVGLSGGIDSSVVAFLAASAFAGETRCALKLIGLIMPSATSDPQDEKDALEVAQALGIEHHVIPIQPLLDAFAHELGDTLATDLHRGNLASETRAVLLSRYAARNRCLVLGTGNRDEDYCLGYFTKRGDGAVDISPIGDLSKRHVRQMAAHLGVPVRILEKAPSAGLWQGQTDEDELGFSYDIAELVLAGRDMGLEPREIAEQANCQLGTVEKVLEVHRSNRHKMELPEIAPVTYV